MLVIDASVVVRALDSPGGFGELPDDELVAPPLLWSEARSVLHEGKWRRALPPPRADDLLRRLERAPVERRQPAALGSEAWSVADELGWAKTYDAEYVALARLLGCRLVTLDARMRRGTERLGFVVTPQEL